MPFNNGFAVFVEGVADKPSVQWGFPGAGDSGVQAGWRWLECRIGTRVNGSVSDGGDSSSSLLNVGPLDNASMTRNTGISVRADRFKKADCIRVVEVRQGMIISLSTPNQRARGILQSKSME